MRHPLHSLCPYFAMFPEDFVAKQLLAYTRRGEWVFDPFSGRGTTVFESLLNGRPAAGTDTNPVAACVSGAKADPPTMQAVLSRVTELETLFKSKPRAVQETDSDLFFLWCYHESTLAEIEFLRATLEWKKSRVDRFIAAVALGCLHGESHKTPNCLSNRMPRTISTKPLYSVNWWQERDLQPPYRKTFEVLRTMVRYRFQEQVPELRGAVKLRDARMAHKAFPTLKEKVALIVTSPPYLDTTDYNEDQWLRLWFLGGASAPRGGLNRDDRHTNSDKYWTFLAEAWKGVQPLVKAGAHVVVRIGGTGVTKKDLLEGLHQSMKTGFAGFKPSPAHKGATTEIMNRQTNVFRPGTSSRRFEHDFTFKLAS